MNAQKIIDRPRLVARFERGLDKQLTLVEAPAGYGKSTLMRSMQAEAEQAGHPTAWFNAEQSDLMPREQLEDLVSRLMAQSSGSTTPILFFDDFHEARRGEKELVRSIVSHWGSPLHIVLGTREPPDIPLARLRLSGDVNDLNVTDLRFDASEARELLFGFVPEAEFDTYFERSEGWAAALLLMRHSRMESGKLDDSARQSPNYQEELADYLNEQFFSQLIEDERSFLLDTAHLHIINGELADFVRDQSGSHILLERLAHSHALVFGHAEIDRDWYRYHQLLRDFLLRRQKSTEGVRLKYLHHRAASWFANNGRTFFAVRHAIDAEDYDHAESILLEAGGMQIGVENGAPQLARYLDLFPLARIYASPRLSIGRALILMKNARIAEAAHLIEGIRTEADFHDNDFRRELIIIEAYLRLYEDKHLTDAQFSALEHMANTAPASDQLVRGVVLNFLCLFYLQAGRLDDAWAAGQKAMSLYEDLKALHLQFFMHVNLSVIDLDLGRFADATSRRERAKQLQEEHFAFDPALRAIADIFLSETTFESGKVSGLAHVSNEALAYAEHAEGWTEVYLAGYETAMTLAVLSKDRQMVTDLIVRAEAMISNREMVRFSHQMLFLQLEFLSRFGLEAETLRLAHSSQDLLARSGRSGHVGWRGRIIANLAMARRELLFGDAARALELVLELVKRCGQQKFERYRLRCHILAVIIAAHQEDRGLAQEHLLSATYLSLSSGLLGAFLREGDVFAEAARWTIRTTGVSAFGAEELAHLSAILWKLSARVGDSPNVLIELLTDREYDVLSVLVAGGSNKVIARELDLSESTVKFHLQNTYQKMGVNSRKMAIELAREYGMSSEHAAP